MDLFSLFIDRGVEAFDDLHGVFKVIGRNDVYRLSSDKEGPVMLALTNFLTVTGTAAITTALGAFVKAIWKTAGRRHPSPGVPGC